MKFKLVLIIFLTILLTAISVIVFRSKFSQILSHSENSNVLLPNKSADEESSLEKQIRDRLQKLEVNPSSIRKQTSANDSIIEIKASIPRGRPMEWIIWLVTNNLILSDYQIYDCYFETEEKGCQIQFTSKSKSNPRLLLTLFRSSAYFSHTAKIAFYIEDFGFQANQTTVEYLSFSEPLTVGLIPEKKLTTWTAQIANEYHKEIIIMLPMEPVPSAFAKQYPSVIMVHYPEDRIKNIINESMGAIPHFAGITNYFGARVTDDSKVMSVICSEIGKKHGYFLLNPQSRASSASAIAKKCGIPFRSIDMSIDSSSSVSSLCDSIRHCAMVAQKTGDIIVSSKATSAFISALKSELPILKQNGIRLIYISELMKNSSIKE